MELKPGYKQTEVGVLPEDWDALRLGQLSEFLTSGSRGWAIHYSRSGPIFVRSQNVRDGRLDFTDNQCVTPPPGAEGSRTQLKISDLLITITGNSVGNVAWVEHDIGEAYISQHVGLVRLLDLSLAQYICFFLSPGSPGNGQIFAAQTGQSKPGLNLKNLENFWIALPPTTAEQKAIAEALSDADAFIESLDQLISQKRQIKQGVMQELLIGKRRLPGFSDEWKERSLSELAEIDPEQIGSGTDPEYEFKYISLEDVDFGSLRGHSLQFFGTAPSRARRKLRVNDLLISTVRPNLKSHLWFRDSSTDWVCSTGFSVVRCFNSLSHPGYVFAHLFADGISRQIDALLTGSNYPAINSRDVRQLKIPVPSLEEQAAIAAILNDMDTELEALESQLAKARQIKQGMMQELLTGRIRLL